VGALAGLSYGVFWGPIIFLSGLALGNLLVIVAVRQLRSLLPKRQKKDRPKKGLTKEKLERVKRPELAAFFLILIPWVSSVGPYLFAETRVSLWKYLIAVVAGSIPAAVLYVVFGDQLSRGNYTTAIVMGAVTVLALVVILLFRKQILAKILDDGEGEK